MSFVGTAFGIIFSVQNGGLAVVTYLMGLVQDKLGHVAVEICFAAFSGVSLLLCFLLWVVNNRKGGALSCVVMEGDDIADDEPGEEEVSLSGASGRASRRSGRISGYSLGRRSGRLSQRLSRSSLQNLDWVPNQEAYHSEQRMCHSHTAGV
mmetsp:Transcript_60902/g.143883  ORF Transcript_60902/g.143883 Transcript_60902/m.143883 type:complete len:151 (+) Transcript_60902:1334-1786(+)